MPRKRRKNAGLSVRKKKMKHGSFNNTLSSPRPNHDAAWQDRSCKQVQATFKLASYGVVQYWACLQLPGTTVEYAWMNQSNLYRVSALPGILQTTAAAQQQQQPLLLLLVRHLPVRTPTVHYRSTTTPALLATLLASYCGKKLWTGKNCELDVESRRICTEGEIILWRKKSMFDISISK
jgi:hypothetical protein